MMRNYIFCFVTLLTLAACPPVEQAPPDMGLKVETYLTGGVVPDNLKFQNKILIPTDDDQALAETVRSGFRTVSDRSRWLQNIASQYKPRVWAFSTDGAEISLTAAPVMVYDPVTDPTNPVWLQFRAPTPVLITPAGLIPHTHYYVYGVNNAGNLDFEISMQPPDSQLIGKAGDVAHRYLFHFRTNTSDALITSFQNVNGKVTYLNNKVNVSPLAGASATIDAALYLPPHAKRAIIESTLANTDTTQGIYIFLRPFGFGLNEALQHAGPANAGPVVNTTSDYLEVTILSQKFDVSINGANLDKWGASVAGYYDE